MNEEDYAITKEQYLEALARNYHAAKQALVLQIQAMSKANFLSEAANHWEDARVVYGDRCDLLTRNLLQEAHKEAHDGIAYRAMDLLKRERGL